MANFQPLSCHFPVDLALLREDNRRRLGRASRSQHFALSATILRPSRLFVLFPSRNVPEEEIVKRRILTYVNAIALFAPLAIPVQLATQHRHYKLIDLGTNIDRR